MSSVLLSQGRVIPSNYCTRYYVGALQNRILDVKNPLVTVAKTFKESWGEPFREHCTAPTKPRDDDEMSNDTAEDFALPPDSAYKSLKETCINMTRTFDKICYLRELVSPTLTRRHAPMIYFANSLCRSVYQMTTFYKVKDGKMVQMTRRLIIGIGGDGFSRSKSRPGFQMTAEFLNFLEFSQRLGMEVQYRLRIGIIDV
jgi:hypothetical protein